MSLTRVSSRTLYAEDVGWRGDGAFDNSARVAALEAEVASRPDRRVVLGDGVFLLNSQWTVGTDALEIVGSGPGRTTLKMADASTSEYAIFGTARTGVTIRDLTLDVNQANRAAPAVRYHGIGFSASTDITVDNVVVKNHSGGATSVAVGISISGGSTRGRVLNCLVMDGVSQSGHGADAVFLAGDEMLVLGTTAINCTDTGFVLEKCNRSTIADCVSKGCSCGGGISATVAGTDYRGNSIRGLTVYDWSAANTGGVQILVNNTGNLLDTQISDLLMVQTAGGGLVGTGLLFRETSSGRIKRVTIDNPQVYGADDHGIGLQGEDITLTGGRVENVDLGTAGSACIRVDGTSVNVRVSDTVMKLGTDGNYGGYALDGAQNVRFQDCTIDGENVSGAWGVFFQGTVTNAEVLFCDIVNCPAGRVGSDAGTTPFVVGRSRNSADGGFEFGKLRDTNLYRNGADVLKTDDIFIAGLGMWSAAVATATTTFAASVTNQLIACDATSGAFSVNLPTAAGANTGKVFTVKKIDASANAVTVDPNGAQTIDGAATYALAAQWKYVTITSDGANWVVTANN